MKGWQVFWTLSLVVAGASFAVITGIVTIRGVQDLRRMFAKLRSQSEVSDV